MDNKKVFYTKVSVGNRHKYIPVSEYDRDLLDALPLGYHLLICTPTGKSSRYQIKPEYACLIAASKVAEDKIATKIFEYCQARPLKSLVTPEQKAAWEALQKSYGKDLFLLTYPSSYDIARHASDVLVEEAEKLLKHPAVRDAYDNFLFVASMTDKSE